MSGEIWIIGEVDDDQLKPSGPGVATLGRGFADAAGREAVGVVVDESPIAAATELATFLPRVLAASIHGREGWLDPAETARVLATLIEAHSPGYIVLPATHTGRAVAILI